MPKLVLALNTNDRRTALGWADAAGEAVDLYKVGLPLYVRYGPSIVEELLKRGPVFLDLKLGDIPSVVGEATAAADGLGAQLLTVHCFGGRAMLEAARKRAERVKLLGVTVLTSLSDEDMTAIAGADRNAASVASSLAGMAAGAGLYGVVCSGAEIEGIKLAHPKLAVVVPGIRVAGSEKGDQARVMTPARAAVLGADYLVVGRPITGADDPERAAKAIAAEAEAGKAQGA